MKKDYQFNLEFTFRSSMMQLTSNLHAFLWTSSNVKNPGPDEDK